MKCVYCPAAKKVEWNEHRCVKCMVYGMIVKEEHECFREGWRNYVPVTDRGEDGGGEAEIQKDGGGAAGEVPGVLRG